MNGIISVPTSRSTLSSKQITTAVAAGVCLFSGFVAGMNISFSSFGIKLPNPLRTETIDYKKVSWVTQTLNLKQIHSAQFQGKTINVEVAFKLFELNSEPSVNPRVASAKLRYKGAFKRLQASFQKFKKEATSIAALDTETYESVMFDFANASHHFNQKFIQIVDTNFEPKAYVAKFDPELDQLNHVEKVIITRSSAEVAEKENLKISKTPKPKKARSMFSTHLQDNDRSKKPVEAFVEKKTLETKPEPEQEQSGKVNNQELSIQTVESPESLRGSFSADSTEAVVIQNHPAAGPNQNKKPEADPLESEKQMWAEALLAVQLQNKLSNTPLAPQINPRPANTTAPATPPANENKIASQLASIDRETETDTSDGQMFMQSEKATTGCDALPGHAFVKPNPREDMGLDTQICPSHIEWLSKSWGGSGWVKVLADQNLPTITLQPAANHGATLLLDQNDLALVALKSGIRIANGMGSIIGLVPAGYQIEFTGRSEETEYFTINDQKYFAVLNAEPGAGVIQLLSEKNSNSNATVFAPVVENTVTYLDLGKPETKNVGIQVVKNPTGNDPEVVGLTVGVSTRGNFQAITQSNGKAILRNVDLVPGFPLFIDVSSKMGDQASYTYRYILNHHSVNGMYVVNQISEKSLAKWLKQVKFNLSEQSAMVVGFYDRKKLDGFKNLYHTRVEPKSSTFGLEPVNYSILWDGKISTNDPLEGDAPRFMAVQVPEGLSQVKLINEANQPVSSELLPISPRVIHVISE